MSRIKFVTRVLLIFAIKVKNSKHKFLLLSNFMKLGTWLGWVESEEWKALYCLSQTLPCPVIEQLAIPSHVALGGIIVLAGSHFLSLKWPISYLAVELFWRGVNLLLNLSMT